MGPFGGFDVDESETEQLVAKTKVNKLKFVVLFMLVLIIMVVSIICAVSSLGAVRTLKEEINDKLNQTTYMAETGIDNLNKSQNEILRRIDGIEGKLFDRGNKVFHLQQNHYCLDTMNGTHNSSLELFACHGNGNNQEWHYTIDDELKNKDSCLTFTDSNSLESSELTLNRCIGSDSQKWDITAGAIRKTNSDICVEARGKDIIAAKCIPEVPEQTFNSKLLYEIDHYCTFKQGSYVLLNAENVIVATNGFLVYRADCLDYDTVSSSLSFKHCYRNWDSNKWKYTDADGQIKNVFKDVCVEMQTGKVAMNKCNLNSSSQQWICKRK